MTPAQRHARFLLRLSLGLLFALGAAAPLDAAPPDAPQVWAGVVQSAAGRVGGLCVHLSAGADGETAELLCQLSRGGDFLVHGLDTDAGAVERLRKGLRERGVYGQAWAEHIEGTRLPYAENLVNILIADDLARTGVPLGEILRVLCPNGVAFIGQSGRVARATGRKLTRDELARMLAPASPSDDAVVDRDGVWATVRKPRPKEMDDWPQPLHGADGNAASGDRLVGPPRRVRWVAGPLQEISNSISAGGVNFYAGVIARDAFNGLRLWELALEPSPARGNYLYRKRTGSVQPVAAGDRLFVLHKNKVRALDAATGESVREYPEAGKPRDLVWYQDTLLAVGEDSIRCVDVGTGKLRWAVDAVSPSCVVAGGGAVFFLAGSARRGERRALARLDADGGKQLWRRADLAWAARTRRCTYHDGLLAMEVSTFNNNKQGNAVHVVSAADGRSLWSRSFAPGMSHYKQARGMFAGGLLWILTGGRVEALDPRTGEVKHKHRAGGGHCYPPVATPRFILSGELTLTDLGSGKVDFNPITKGNCGRDAGFMPANGLVYVTPKHCACWPMLRGYAALAPAGGAESKREVLRVEKRAAFGQVAAPAARPDEWPCYRHDKWRSASTAAAVPPDLEVLWTAGLGDWPKGRLLREWKENLFVRGPVSAPVVGGGLVVVARSDAHEVVALDAGDGTVRWRFTADGRIDMPPTLHEGLCLFGTRSGWVHCLRAADGVPAWRLRAGANDDRIVCFGQLESPWPVAGSLLVSDGVAYFAAGRHPLADGGLVVVACEPAAGRVLWTKRVDSLRFRSYYGGLGLEFDCIDLLVAESVRAGGERITLSRWQFHPKTGQMSEDLRTGFGYYQTNGRGVLAPRGHWTYGPRQNYIGSPGGPGAVVPTRQERRPLVAFRGATLFSASDDKRSLFRRDFSAKDLDAFDTQWFSHRRRNERARKGGDVSRAQRLGRAVAWRVKAAARGGIAAMVLAGDTLFLAGRQGGLEARAAADGRQLATLAVPAVAWDALAAAHGRLYLATRDGKVLCLGRK